MASSQTRDRDRSAPTICLAMIVRDEAAIIDRCLDSVEGRISSWRVIDTGSTDDTIAKIQERLGHLPGEVRSSPWVDFGHNRTELIEWARDAADWLLLMDADLEAEFSPGFDEELAAFEADQGLISVRESVHYRMPYLVRADKCWRYRGRTHEHLSCDEPYSSQWFESLSVTHHGDGGSKADKFERDIRLLTQDLLDDPDNPRTHFYLAQSLKDSGDVHAAIDHYQRRVALGGWEEERFFAQYQVGVLQAELGLAEASDSLLAAWELRPTRAEPVFQLARSARIARRHHVAWLFSNVAASLPLPTEDKLFVEAWVYDWAAAFERCDAAWRIGDHSLALEIAAALDERSDLPEEFREHLELIRSEIAAAHDLGG